MKSKVKRFPPTSTMVSPYDSTCAETQRKRANDMKLGILGTGHVAQLLAAAWKKAGHDITLGSRDPGSKSVAFPVKTLVEAASGADIIINAIVGSAGLETISSIDADAFA